MSAIRITSKRQATLPKELCDELGVGPGDRLLLERRTIEGETVWVVLAPRPDWSWFGSLRRYAEGKSHDWDDIEESIGRGFAEDYVKRVESE